VPNLYFMIAKGTLGQQTGEQDLPVWDHWQLHFHLHRYVRGPRWEDRIILGFEPFWARCT
jgi:hypothetical protein